MMTEFHGLLVRYTNDTHNIKIMSNTTAIFIPKTLSAVKAEISRESYHDRLTSVLPLNSYVTKPRSTIFFAVSCSKT